MSTIKTFHIGQRYFVGEVIVDDRELYSQTKHYTTPDEAMDELEGLHQECETDINCNGDRLVESFVRKYEVKSLSDDGTVGEAESVGPGVALVDEMLLAPSDAEEMAADYPKAAELMSVLDSCGFQSEQDWVNGVTTWTLDDGSKIWICGDDVKAIAAQ